MKAILEFTLPEESEDHLSALNGSKYKYIIDNTFNWIRSKTKYSPKPLSKKEYDLLEEMREFLANELNDLES